MSRNKWVSIFSLVVIVAMLAGCGAAEPQVIKETEVVEVEKEVEKIVTEVVEKEVMVEVTATPEFPDDVTLVYWSDPRFTLVKGKEDQTQVVGDYEMLLAEQFMAMHPNVTIEVEALQWADLSTKVTAAIAAGSPPNVLKDYLGRTSGYAWQDLLEPLEDCPPPAELDDYSARPDRPVHNQRPPAWPAALLLDHAHGRQQGDLGRGSAPRISPAGRWRMDL